MGIQQKLHTKLVQKLILTPSLQQAIKLLPMSTLELSDLLNQEMVENPMLEEVPTEELQPAETQQTQEKTEPEQQANKTDTWDDQDYEYFFGDYLDDGYRPRAPQEVKELPPIENTLDRKSTRLNSSHSQISYAVFCLKKKTNDTEVNQLSKIDAKMFTGRLESHDLRYRDSDRSITAHSDAAHSSCNLPTTTVSELTHG